MFLMCSIRQFSALIQYCWDSCNSKSDLGLTVLTYRMAVGTTWGPYGQLHSHAAYMRRNISLYSENKLRRCAESSSLRDHICVLPCVPVPTAQCTGTSRSTKYLLNPFLQPRAFPSGRVTRERQWHVTGFRIRTPTICFNFGSSSC